MSTSDLILMLFFYVNGLNILRVKLPQLWSNKSILSESYIPDFHVHVYVYIGRQCVGQKTWHIMQVLRTNYWNITLLRTNYWTISLLHTNYWNISLLRSNYRNISSSSKKTMIMLFFFSLMICFVKLFLLSISCKPKH